MGRPQASRSLGSDKPRRLYELSGLDEIGPELAENPKEAGYKIPNDLREADDLDPPAVDGIGKDQLSKLGARL